MFVWTPGPLSLTDLEAQPTHGSRLRVAYQVCLISYSWMLSLGKDVTVIYPQGLPGAYSEAAANIAYSNCEDVPCDQFEAAFHVKLYNYPTEAHHCTKFCKEIKGKLYNSNDNVNYESMAL